MQGHLWQVEFIGRLEEIDSIEAQLQAWGTRRVVFVHGPGGIGKTRFLDEIEKRFADQAVHPQIDILPIIDFDDGRYRFS